MAKQLAVENGEKLQKVPFLKIVFCNIAPLGDQKKWSHMKVKSKISYLGKRNSILPGHMAEQLAVEVDVKNVTEQQYTVHTDKLLYLVWIISLACEKMLCEKDV